MDPSVIKYNKLGEPSIGLVEAQSELETCSINSDTITEGETGAPTPAESSGNSQEYIKPEASCGFFNIAEPEIWAERLPVLRIQSEETCSMIEEGEPENQQGLVFLKASYGGLDVTRELQKLTRGDDSMTIDLTRIAKSLGSQNDLAGWNRNSRCLSMIYQYDGGLPRLYISDHLTKIIEFGPLDIAYQMGKPLLNFNDSTDHKVHILAIIWHYKEIRDKYVHDSIYKSIDSETSIRIDDELLGGYASRCAAPYVGTFTIYYRRDQHAPVECSTGIKDTELWIKT